MERFIYTQGKETRDKAIKLGYRLIRSDDENEIYIFEAPEGQLNFANLDGVCTMSNTIIF